MALDSYANLKTALQTTLDRDDLASQVDDFIDIAEAVFRDELRFREILTRGTIAITAGDTTASLPADYAQLKSLRLQNPVTSHVRRYMPPLVQVTEDEFIDHASTQEGPAKFFLISDEIEFDREADQDYTLDILYYKTMTALSGANTSNELLVRAPDVYYWGSLVASAPFLHEDERLVTWGSLYTTARDRVNKSERQNRRAGPQVARVKGV